MDTIKLTLDGKELETERGKSVLEAALEAGSYIPHLCYHPDLRSTGDCGLCVVEIEGFEGLPPACNTSAADGMRILSKTDKVAQARRAAMEKMLSGHPADCGTCIKYLNCELQSLKQYFAIDQLTVERHPRLFAVNSKNPLFTIDPNKCVLCERCVRACKELRGVGILSKKLAQNGDYYIGTSADLSLAEAGCRFCGACAEVCPTGSIMDKEELTHGKNRKTALLPCRYTCPAEIDVPGYLRFIRNQDYSSAVALIREKVPFPDVLGYVCDHPCEGVCRRTQVNQSISIRELKKFAVAQDIEKSWQNRISLKPATGQKVAVIGSGPAGLTAAYFLALQGHAVTVYESLSLPGGMLRFGIPEYRLPGTVVETEIMEIEKLGIVIKTNTSIESIDGLFKDGFNAVLMAVGTHKGQKLRIPGVDHLDVILSIDFLRDSKQRRLSLTGKRVLVIGGGNVAFDSARVALRMGAESVRIACLESAQSMPASEDEIEEGKQEGIIILPSRTFKRVVIENGIIKGVECLEVESLNFDENQVAQIVERPGTEHVLEANMIIMAVGQQPVIPDGFDLGVSERKLVEVDSFNNSTDKEGVFAAGDAVTGTSSVIKAIASGRKAAASIDRFLGGDGSIDMPLAVRSEPDKVLGLRDGFASLLRYQAPVVPVETRIGNFCRVTGDMSENTAKCESNRCLQCDLRLKIKQVKFWSNY